MARLSEAEEQAGALAIDPGSMRLHAMDAWVADPSVLTDLERLKQILYEGAAAGDTTILGEQFCVFPNGAVTGVLVLAQSHLSVHTWPELLLANVDLLSYGDLDGEHVMKVIEKLLGAERTSLACVPRGVAAR
jgi:S-adenosylmethionine decarboxylase